ncbi:hypothetical protein CIW47_14130 [Mycolicibacterium sp. P1-5]|nr:hypothetical protein CIW47_14130 [Mycolicibacterium sp. P1-5]
METVLIGISGLDLARDDALGLRRGIGIAVDGRCFVDGGDIDRHHRRCCVPAADPQLYCAVVNYRLDATEEAGQSVFAAIVRGDGEAHRATQVCGIRIRSDAEGAVGIDVHGRVPGLIHAVGQPTMRPVGTVQIAGDDAGDGILRVLDWGDRGRLVEQGVAQFAAHPTQ